MGIMSWTGVCAVVGGILSLLIGYGILAEALFGSNRYALHDRTSRIAGGLFSIVAGVACIALSLIFSRS